jgi:drug/metabolite transporter (DMT)-like permease
VVRPRPLPTLFAVCLGWGSIPALVRPVGLPPEVITASRVWLASVALGLVLLVRPGALGSRPSGGGVVDRRRVAILAVASGALLAAHWTLQFAAYQRAAAPTVSFVIFLAPVGIAALAPAVLGEPTPRRTVAALALALLGAALVTGPSAHGTTAVGVLLAGLSAVGLVGLTLVAKPLTLAIGGARAALAQFAVAAVVLSPVLLRLLSGAHGRPRASWALLLVLGLVHTALFVSLYLWALGQVPVATAGVIGELEPVGVTIVAVLQGRLPSLSTLAGGALILAAGAVVATAFVRRPPTASPLLEVPRVPG